MKLAAFGLAVAGLITGIVAAIYWWTSAQVSVEPPYCPGGIPTDPETENVGWLINVLAAWQKASPPNRKAAVWAGVSAILNGASAVFGNWPF